MSINKQVKNGVKWTTVSTIILAFVAILKVSILARFLEKSDFGLMALVTFIMGFMELFNDMGLSSAILHKQEITKKQYSSLYWLNAITSLCMFSVLYLIVPIVSDFYNQDILKDLIPLVGLNLLITGIGSQFKVIEQKHLNFKTISIIDIVGGCLSLTLSFILAWKGYGVYALVYSLLFQSLFSNLFYFILGINKYGLLFHFKIAETKDFLRIGIYQVGGQIVNYFNRDLDILIIGKFFSADILGGYSLAKQLVYRPAQLINPILVKVASPTLALFQNNINDLRNRYLGLINIVSTINFTVYTGIILFAPWIVQLLYGGGFDDIVLIVRILSLYMIIRSMGNPVGSLVIATGRTDLEFVWNIITLLIMPLFICIGAQFGIIGVSISVVLAMVLLYYPSWKFLIYKLTKSSFKMYFKACFYLNFRQILIFFR